MEIDYSQLTAWKQCRMRHYFQYTLDVEPKKPQSDLLLGSAVHYALERFHGYGEDISAAFESDFARRCRELASSYALSSSEADAFSDLELLGRAMLAHYLHEWSTCQDFTTVVSEFTFHVPIPTTDGSFKGRIDGIVQDTYGDYWIIEHKTAGKFPQPAYFALDEQSLLYQWAVQQVITSGDIPIIPPETQLVGWCYNGLRKAIPRRPPLLKSGEGVSKAQIDSTYAVYLDTLSEHGFAPASYEGLLAQLAQQGNTFFRRAWFRRTRRELQVIARRLGEVYLDMRDSHFIYPTPTQRCPQCPYYEPCLETQKGGHVDFILDYLYQPRQHRPSEEEGTPVLSLEELS